MAVPTGPTGRTLGHRAPNLSLWASVWAEVVRLCYVSPKGERPPVLQSLQSAFTSMSFCGRQVHSRGVVCLKLRGSETDFPCLGPGLGPNPPPSLVTSGHGNFVSCPMGGSE